LVFGQGDALTMHYRGTLTNGKQFDASYDRGQPFKFQIGVGQVAGMLERDVKALVLFCDLSDAFLTGPLPGDQGVGRRRHENVPR